ncbi:MAG: site-specific tyrosine recombinase/integron integrase [Promethearchaeia archaeon]
MGDYSFSDYVEDFLIAKEIEEGCAKSTIQAYKYDLEMFQSIVGDIDLASPFNRRKIRIFLKELKQRGYSKKGIARKIASLRSFYNFLNVNDFLKGKNPMKAIQTPTIREEEQLPKYLDICEIERIFKVTKDRTNFSSKKRKRYYVIVRLLYASMARVSELCDLKVKDVNFQEGYIKLRGKGNKERIVPVDQGTLKAIREYLEDRLFVKPDDYLIVNTQNGQLTPRVVQKDIKTIKEKCGFSDSKVVTPHIFRHTGATHLRRSGMDISELQDILGHSSPTTTRIYAKNDITQLKQSYREMHPLNTLKI